MKTIELTQGYITVVDDSDYEWLNQWKWYYHHGYAQRSEKVNGHGTTVLMSREIMDAPAGMEADHWDNDTLNNRRKNLRVVTHAENGRNRRLDRDSISGLKGVRQDQRSGKWNAHIQADGEQIHLGIYDTSQEAAYAYDMAALGLHGDYAKTNFELMLQRAFTVMHETESVS